jgi:hypothetical protein
MGRGVDAHPGVDRLTAEPGALAGIPRRGVLPW